MWRELRMASPEKGRGKSLQAKRQGRPQFQMKLDTSSALSIENGQPFDTTFADY
jgi:hypothetical protein